MDKNLEKKIKQLNELTDDLLGSIDDVAPDKLQEKGRGWSIMQVFSHLEMSEAASLNYMKKKILAGKDMPRVSAMGKFKMGVTNALLKSPLRWKAPSYISNPKGDYSLDEIKSKWSKTREEVTAYVAEYPDEFLDRAVFRHPMSGRQGLGEALDSMIYHVYHHKHQVKRIRKELGI